MPTLLIQLMKDPGELKAGDFILWGSAVGRGATDQRRIAEVVSVSHVAEEASYQVDLLGGELLKWTAGEQFLICVRGAPYQMAKFAELLKDGSDAPLMEDQARKDGNLDMLESVISDLAIKRDKIKG